MIDPKALLRDLQRLLKTLESDRHESYFRANPTHSDRDYLIACFRESVIFTKTYQKMPAATMPCCRRRCPSKNSSWTAPWNRRGSSKRST